MPTYDYKHLAELGWAALTAVLVVLAQAMLTLDPDKVTDWKAWAIGVAAAAVRAIGGALLSWLGTARANAGASQ